MRESGMPSQRARHQLAWAIGLYVAGVVAMGVVSYGLELFLH